MIFHQFWRRWHFPKSHSTPSSPWLRRRRGGGGTRHGLVCCSVTTSSLLSHSRHHTSQATLVFSRLVDNIWSSNKRTITLTISFGNKLETPHIYHITVKLELWGDCNRQALTALQFIRKTISPQLTTVVFVCVDLTDRFYLQRLCVLAADIVQVYTFIISSFFLPPPLQFLGITIPIKYDREKVNSSS